MNITHPSFSQPLDVTTPVWRYLNMEKFVSLLADKALYFSRSDLLGDPHEGTIPALNAKNIHTQFYDPDKPDLIIKVRKMWKLFTYVNCWHINYAESDAMWRLYCPNKDGVALKSTYAKLAESVDNNDFYLGLVRYIDYRSQLLPLDNAFNPIMHKRKVFEHEREVRAVTMRQNTIRSVERDFDERKCLEENPKGVRVPINIVNMVDCVYVNPYASEQYYKMVKEILDKFSISLPLERSSIADVPNP